MYDSNKEIEAGTDGEWIVDNLCPSDNVAIPTTNEPFWLMLIEKGPHVVAKSFKDDANESTEGDMVIWNYYNNCRQVVDFINFEMIGL